LTAHILRMETKRPVVGFKEGKGLKGSKWGFSFALHVYWISRGKIRSG
jgi:hypothetical protein